MPPNETTPLALYASVGNTLLHYSVDVNVPALEKCGSVTLPVDVQYAWPNPRMPYIHVACSNGSPGVLGDTHCAVSLRMDANGTVRCQGDPVELPSRPIHITVDATGAYALIAYNDPSGLTVHRIRTDGTLSEAVPQNSPVDVGVFAHQVRLMPSNKTVVLVTRGHDANEVRREIPGALKVYDFYDGQLTKKASVAPNAGFGFGPRHLDFHPSQAWAYVSLERQNQIHLYHAPHDVFEPKPAHVEDTLAEPENLHAQQRAGTIHVHPKGHVVYCANRASDTTTVRRRSVFSGGENNIAVYSIDQQTGFPQPIQHIATHGFVPRTFSIDPDGRLLVAANSQRFSVEDGPNVVEVPASLAVFRVAENGMLSYVSKYDIDTGEATLFWMGIVRTPGPH